MSTIDHHPEWIRMVCIMLYFTSCILIIMSIRKLWITRDNFFLHLRHPLSCIFFISICLIYNILNLTEFISRRYYIYNTEWGSISFITFNNFQISALMYALYIIFHAIIQQFTILHRLNNAQNHIHRLVSKLMEATASNTTQHENMIRSVLIIYNLFLFIVTIFSIKILSVSVLFGYNLLLTPQFLLLDILTLLMYQYTPRQYDDMFNLKKQWNHIVFCIVIPSNIMLFSTYVFPSYFSIIHSICDLVLLFKYTWSISTYPITLHLKSQRQLASMQYPKTWQQFLCKHDHEIQLLNIPTDEAISYINNHMFHNMNTVSPAKLELFMREFGNPENDKHCISELLFVSELSQIKSQLISIIGPTATDECGLIISIPNGLLPSCLISTHLSQWLDSINVDNIYDIIARLYLKYMDYYTATVPICYFIDTLKLDVVYDKLITEYPQIMCLTQPMTELELSISRSASDDKQEVNEYNQQNEYKYTEDDPETFNLQADNREVSVSIITGIDDQELQNIYKLIRTYDEILSECNVKVQNCYEYYKSINIEHYDGWHALI